MQESEPVPEPETRPEPELKKESVAEAPIPKKPAPKMESNPKPRPVSKPKENPKTAPEPKKQVRREAAKSSQPRQDSRTDAIATSDEQAASPGQTVGTPKAGESTGIATLVYGQAEDPFLAEVKRRVEAALKYPRKARVMRMQGTTVVQFVVSKNGAVSELAIVSSSGHALLDKTAVQAIETARSQWGAPEKTVRLRFPIRFHVRG